MDSKLGPGGKRSPGSVLVIEDDQAIRDTLRLALEMENYKVDCAANGQEGLEKLRSIDRPCVILLDLMMPVMDGWAFKSALERNKTLAAIPVVVVTAFSEKGVGIKAKKILKKPVDLDLLSRTVGEICIEGSR